MNWTAQILNIENDGTTKTVTFVFHNPVTDETITNHVARGFSTDKQIKKYAYDHCKAFADKESITLAKDDVIDFTEFLPQEPTADELAKRAFEGGMMELAQLKRLKELDARLVTDAELQAKAEAVLNLKPVLKVEEVAEEIV